MYTKKPKEMGSQLMICAALMTRTIRFWSTGLTTALATNALDLFRSAFSTSTSGIEYKGWSILVDSSASDLAGSTMVSCSTAWIGVVALASSSGPMR